MLEGALTDLLKLFENELYWPIFNAIESTEWARNFVDFINNVLAALFGHQSLISIEMFTAALTFIIFLTLVIIVINLFKNLFNFTIDNLQFKKKRRR
jgi:hypothetical protein